MSNTKQTAVEWLHDNLFSLKVGGFNETEWDMFQQAKQMEKEQMKASWNQTFKSNFQTFEHYYTQTYEN